MPTLMSVTQFRGYQANTVAHNHQGCSIHYSFSLRHLNWRSQTAHQTEIKENKCIITLTPLEQSSFKTWHMHISFQSANSHTRTHTHTHTHPNPSGAFLFRTEWTNEAHMKIRKPNRSASCTTALKKREHPPSPGSPRSAERSATNNTKGKTVLQLPGRENDQQKKSVLLQRAFSDQELWSITQGG